jgi:hypothetical protein
MNEEYINSVTLEYLLNPVLYNKINDQKIMSDNFIFKDIKFYKRRICQLTKDMCKGEYVNDNLKTFFLNYAHALVYYLKQLDEKDIFQEQYDGLISKFSTTDVLDISNSEVNEANIENDINSLLINKPQPVNNLDSFVKKINIKSEERILPQRRIANIKDPKLKKKGLKKKIST